MGSESAGVEVTELYLLLDIGFAWRPTVVLGERFALRAWEPRGFRDSGCNCGVHGSVR